MVQDAHERGEIVMAGALGDPPQDRKSTRLNSSHSQISYAVFCLKKKKMSDTNDTVVTGIEMLRNSMDELMAGDAVAVLLHGIENDYLERGLVIADPKYVTAQLKC